MQSVLAAITGLLALVGPTVSAGSGILALLAKVVPSLGSASAVGKAIEVLTTIVPAGIKLAQDEYPIIKAIIADLRGNGATTKEQMDTLDAFDAQCDKVFDVALAKAETEDKEPQ